MYACVFVYVYACAGNICMSADAQGGQNRVTDTLELDKREVVCRLVQALRTEFRSSGKGHKLLTTEFFLQPCLPQPEFYIDAREPNSDPHSWAAGTLPAKTSPQPC